MDASLTYVVGAQQDISDNLYLGEFTNKGRTETDGTTMELNWNQRNILVKILILKFIRMVYMINIFNI